MNQDPSGLGGGVNFFSYAQNPVSWIDPLGLQKKVSVLLGGTGRYPDATSSKTPALFKPPATERIKEITDWTPNTSDLIKNPNYDIRDLAEENKLWQSLSTNDYTQYCDEWREDNGLSCGKSIQTPRDYIPSGPFRTADIPNGYICIKPYYFLDLKQRGSAPTADISDVADLLRQMRSNNRARR